MYISACNKYCYVKLSILLFNYRVQKEPAVNLGQKVQRVDRWVEILFTGT